MKFICFDFDFHLQQLGENVSIKKGGLCYSVLIDSQWREHVHIFGNVRTTLNISQVQQRLDWIFSKT